MPATPSTHRSAPRRRAAEKLPFPELPPTDGDSIAFWLAAFQRDDAQAQALKDLLATSFVRARCDAHRPVSLALTGAMNYLEDEARKSLKHLTEAGGLLYAWPGTRYLEGSAA